MLSSTEIRRRVQSERRGYHAVYHDGEINHCPGCGRTHWLIGRLSAECAFCSTALPLREASNHGPAADGLLERSAHQLRRAQRRLNSSSQFHLRRRCAGIISCSWADLAIRCAHCAGRCPSGRSGEFHAGQRDQRCACRSVDPPRRHQEWKSLGAAPAAGARVDELQRSRLRLRHQRTVGASPVTWTGVNLCGAKSVVLQRDAAAGAWVDYDQ